MKHEVVRIAYKNSSKKFGFLCCYNANWHCIYIVGKPVYLPLQ